MFPTSDENGFRRGAHHAICAIRAQIGPQDSAEYIRHLLGVFEDAIAEWREGRSELGTLEEVARGL